MEAVEGQPCTHEHGDECGYAEGQPCTHEHDESCGYVEEQSCTHEHDEKCGVEGQDCTHEHDESCGYAEGQSCTHEHGDECGYVEGQDCVHEHDENCGYVEAVEGQPCQYVCEICEGLEEVPEEKTEQDKVMMADKPMTRAAANEKGLIAYFTFDDESDRMKNSANSSVAAKLHVVKSGQADPGDEIDSESLGDYFNGTDEDANALHLQNDACLVLTETEDFNELTEMTVEMRIRITGKQGQHWLFYAVPNAEPGNNTPTFLGAFINSNNTRINIARSVTNNDTEIGKADFQCEEEEWYTVRAVYKPSNIALYINNKRVIDQSVRNKTSNYFGVNKTLWFGHSAWTGDSNFDGYIDEIKIYNYANYDKPNGSYLDGYIDEQEYIVESVDPPQHYRPYV